MNKENIGDTKYPNERGVHMEYLNMLNGYDDVLSPQDIMKILHTGRNTVYEYLNKGKIRSFMIGGKYRIPKLYLLEFIYPDISFSRKEG